MFNAMHILAAASEAGGESLADKAGKVVKTFHIEWALFGAQWITFILVALLLKKFAFGPVQKILEQRRNRISEGEAKLTKIEQQLAESEKTTAAAIAKANDEAVRLINEAKTSAVALSEQKAQEAIASAQQILAKAEVAAKAERAQIAAELKKEFGRLITDATTQVTGKILTADDQARINQEALATVER